MTNLMKQSSLPLAACGFIFATILSMSGSALVSDALEQTSQPNKGSLTVRIETAKAEGAVMIALYADAASYSGGEPVTGKRIPLTNETALVTLHDLPYGQYAIKAFHDLDGDGKLTTNPFGAPVEPFAFSNSAQAHYGPPPFEKAAITLSSPEATDTLSFKP